MELTHDTGMRELSLLEIDEVAGGAISDLSWQDLGAVFVGGAIIGGLYGALGGGAVSFGILTIPGWAVGALTGGSVAGITYIVVTSLSE